MADIKVYTTNMCGYCTVAKRLLTKRGIPFQEINVSGDAAQRAWLVKTTGRRTVPQIFIDGDPIGGSDELHEMDRSGELARRIGAPSTVE
ncbi:MAG: glutaredoxin [Myxococcaceae bacterium]|jgi:glutaredoxin 3|nr:glutaredoxin [Myxococcaceae bacterium]